MTDFLQAFLGGISYSVFGFLFGWLGGYEARVLREMRGVIVEKGLDETEVRAAHRGQASKRRSSFGVLLVILAALTLLQSAYFTYQQREVTECLSEYNENLAKVQQLRADWAQQDRDDLMNFLYTFEGGESSASRQQAFRSLVDTYERNAEKRRDTPLPELKSCD